MGDSKAMASVAVLPAAVRAHNALHDRPNYQRGCATPATSSVCDWHLDRMARAISVGDVHSVRQELRHSIRRVPYHGLWLGAANTKAHHAIAMGQLGQDLVRSCNQALGQYVTAEKLAASLKRAYREASLLAEAKGIRLDVLSQEYNMVFLRASRLPTEQEAVLVQGLFDDRVAKHLSQFFEDMAAAYPERQGAIDAVRQSLDVSKPLINLGFCAALGTPAERPLERLARTAIGASAAAKLARLRPQGFAIAEASAVVSALRQYFSLLEAHLDLEVGKDRLALRDKTGRLLLNPAVLVAYRSKTLSTSDSAALVSQLVALLNCLDWVQQSRFADLSSLHQKAMLGRSLMRQLAGRAPSARLQEIKSFALGHVPYLGIAEENTRAAGTLIWVDMKKLSVRCHLIREQKAAELLRRLDDRQPVEMRDIVEGMIAIDLRVQDAREVLPQTARVAQAALCRANISASLRSHFGGDDAALFVHADGAPLPPEVAQAVGDAIARECDQVRVAHCAVGKGANIAEQICKLDRILTATKVD